ncbi:MAG: tRNA 2-thiouridine(34) synthase MnmA [Caldimicrobium sp.]|nr:tRNA 2-thiouridine(34) synthase MnmA [Caldimicrobium sp.]MCX7873551.1 tRNA 2-thiouridine(34) synthase MnmA [Caldimicrobium sp.]
MVDMKRIAIAMSGGVDSSYSALLLKKTYAPKGTIVGVSFLLFEELRPQLEKARQIAEHIGIEHHIIDLREDFQREVKDYFLRSYAQGLTPNPCAICNRTIKFGLVPRLILKSISVDGYATGHYVSKGEHKGYILLKSSSNKARDQSYFLALIERDLIPLLLFPVGNFSNKEEVIKLAKEEGLNIFQFKESQDVCFLQGKTLREYLREYLPEREGEIIYRGKRVGTHMGIHFYTLGQRKGLRIPLGRPLYIVRIDERENKLYLGDEQELLRESFYVKDINFHLPLDRWNRVSAQIRYRTERIVISDIVPEGSLWRIKLAKPTKRITPGQICAFYEGDYLLGGGIIAKDI